MKKLLAAAALSVMAIPAQAATIVYNASGLTGNQDWTGTLGLDFQVNSAVKVTQLGVFDSGSNGIANDLFVGIFNSNGTLLTSTTISGGSGNSGASNYIFSAIADLTLAPGSYQLASWGYDSVDLNFNYGFIFAGDGGPVSFDTLGGALTPLGSSFSNAGTGGIFATNADVGTTRYGAGSFIAELAPVVGAVPEPATWGLMIVGFGMAGAGLRRRKAFATA